MKQWVANSFDDSIRFDMETLPVTHVQPPKVLLGLIVAVVPTVVGLSFVGDGLREVFRSPTNLVMLFFVLFFASLVVAAVVAGLWLMTCRTTTRLDSETVSEEKSWCFGNRAWSEPLKNYKGVVYRSEYHAGRKNSPSYTLYIVELHHDNPRRRVILLQSRSESGVRGMWVKSCRLLGLPAFEQEGKTLVERDVDDLGKSVRERVREGRLVVTFDPAVRPPRGLALSVQDETLRIAINKGFWLARPGLDVGRDRVRYYRRTPWGEAGVLTVSTDAIEDVRIGRTAGERRDAVQLCSNEGTMTVGQGLSRECLEWLKNCVIAVVTR